jgi:hypothetical protein
MRGGLIVQSNRAAAFFSPIETTTHPDQEDPGFPEIS